MKKQVFGRKLKRDTNERKALFKGLASSLVMYERIETTEEKAKSVKGMVEKLVTKAKKKEGVHLQGLLQPYLTHEAVVKMVGDIAPRFTNRPGGYIRIIKTRQRFSDNANMVFMEWVEKAKAIKTQVVKADKKVKTENVKAETVKPVKKAAAKTEKKTTKKVATKKTEVKEKKK